MLATKKQISLSRGVVLLEYFPSSFHIQHNGSIMLASCLSVTISVVVHTGANIVVSAPVNAGKRRRGTLRCNL